MATRSLIGYINKNNRVKLGYCHCDGYLEHNGIVLQNYYNNMEIVKNLLKGKGVHFLTDNIRKNRYFRDDDLISNHMTLDDLLINLDKEVMIGYFYLYLYLSIEKCTTHPVEKCTGYFSNNFLVSLIL